MQFSTLRFPVFVLGLQLLFLVLFAVFVRYPERGLPVADGLVGSSSVPNATDRRVDDEHGGGHGGHGAAAPVVGHAEHGEISQREVAQYYPCEYSVVCKFTFTSRRHRYRVREISENAVDLQVQLIPSR